MTAYFTDPMAEEFKKAIEKALKRARLDAKDLDPKNKPESRRAKDDSKKKTRQRFSKRDAKKLR